MKAIVSALVLLVAGCAGGGEESVPEDGAFDPSALEDEVRFLAADEMRGREPGTPEDGTLRAHIAERFAAIGLRPAGDSFQQELVDSRGRETANVVAVLDGSDPAVAGEIIVIGAHHDHLGARQGRVFNGANDNASGVATVLAVAEAIAGRAARPRRTLLFATFGSEELGLEGSRHLVRAPPDELRIADVVYMVNLDMVGTYFNDDWVYGFGSFAGTPARAALDQLLAGRDDLTVELAASAVEVEGRGDSDYDPFCRAGIPYLYFFTEDDECYHRACDDPDRLDYGHMADIAELTAGALVWLADTPLDLRRARAELGCGER